MHDKATRFTTATAVLLFSLLAFPSWLQPQTAPAESRDTVVQEIKAYTARHVKANSPMQTGIVIQILSDNHAGLSSDDIARIYENQYILLKNAENPPFWAEVTHNKPFLWLLALFLASVAVYGLKSWLAERLKKLLDNLYRNVAGFRYLSYISLVHYRNALAERYRTVKTVAWVRGLRLDRAARNPLHGLLDASLSK